MHCHQKMADEARDGQIVNGMYHPQSQGEEADLLNAHCQILSASSMQCALCIGICIYVDAA